MCKLRWLTFLAHPVYIGECDVWKHEQEVACLIGCVMSISNIDELRLIFILRWGPSYTHCCRALTFASARLSYLSQFVLVISVSKHSRPCRNRRPIRFRPTRSVLPVC